jgi:hypothetical protein
MLLKESRATNTRQGNALYQSNMGYCSKHLVTFYKDDIVAFPSMISSDSLSAEERREKSGKAPPSCFREFGRSNSNAVLNSL